MTDLESSGFLPARKPVDLNAEEWSYIAAAVGRYRHDHIQECERCDDFSASREDGDEGDPCEEQRSLAHLEEVTGHIAREMSP